VLVAVLQDHGSLFLHAQAVWFTAGLVLHRTAVDGYLRARDPSGPFLASLRGRISLSQQESIMQGTRYNVPLLNALVFYVGIEVSLLRWSVSVQTALSFE
jgi:hypothetical protein